MGASIGPWTVLRGHSAEVQALEFLDANHLFSGDSDGCIKLWDIHARRPGHAVQVHGAQAGVMGLQCIRPPSGSAILLSAGRDGTLHAHQVLTSGALSSEPVSTIRAGAHGFCKPHAVCTAAEPGQDACTHSNTGSKCAVPRPATTLPPTPAAAADAWLVAWGSSVSGQVCLWDLRRAATQPVLQLPPPDISSTPFAGVPRQPSSSTGGAGGAPGVAHTVGSVMAVKFRRPPQPPHPALATGSASADLEGESNPESQPEQLMVGYESGSVAVWDTRQPQQPVRLAVRPHTEPVLCLEISPGGDRALSGSADSQVHMWGLPTDAELRNTEAALLFVASHSLPQPGVSHAAWRADGRVAATAGWDGKVRVFSGKGSHKPAAVLKYHTQEVTCVAWCPGPHSAHLTSNMPHWQMDAGDALEDHEGVIGVRRDQGLGLLASSSRDGSVALWRVFPWACND